MIKTPLGKIEILVDGIPAEYHAEKIPLSRSCSELGGRFLITVGMPPDSRERCVSCCLIQEEPPENDCIEAGRGMEAKSFYKGRSKVTIAMAGEEGQECLYRAEYRPDGVQYRLRPTEQPLVLDFGAAWLNGVTAGNNLQTWIGAAPEALHQVKRKPRLRAEITPILSDVVFQDDFPTLEESLYDNRGGVGSVETWEPFPQENCAGMEELLCSVNPGEQPDRLLHLTLNYHRTRIDPQDTEDDPAEHHVEQVILDRTEQSLTYSFREMEQEFSGKYIRPNWIEFIFASLEKNHFPQMQRDDTQDVLEQQFLDPTYCMTAYYAKAGRHTIRGRLDQLGVPDGYSIFASELRNFWAYLSASEMLAYGLCDRMPRRASDLMFCKVWVDQVPGRQYTYLCQLPEIREDSWVLVPFGKNNAVKVGHVQCVEYAQPENAPYPIQRTKCILKECTQADLEEKVKQERTLNPYAIEFSNSRSAAACHKCPLFGCNLYWGGRGGCCDVGSALGKYTEFKDHFEKQFDPEDAVRICEACGWRDMNEDNY